MYKTDSVLLEKFKNSTQTAANDNDPRLVTYIARNKTAITTQRFWEKQLVTDKVGTRSSIALRRPKGHFSADMIFTAQVEGGDAVIRYAEPWSNIYDMDWNVLTTIPNVSELSIMFDGIMKKEGDLVEAYTIGNYPYAIYVQTDGVLKVMNLDSNDPSITISDLAVNVATVRGLYSASAGVDDGIFIFYTNTEGQLWEAQLLNGEIIYLSRISNLPEGVTSWEDCWASLTFDYRVVLQLKGNDGKVHCLFSSSRPSGFSLLEHVTMTTIKVSGEIGTSALTLLSVDSVGV